MSIAVAKKKKLKSEFYKRIWAVIGESRVIAENLTYERADAIRNSTPDHMIVTQKAADRLKVSLEWS